MGRRVGGRRRRCERVSRNDCERTVELLTELERTMTELTTDDQRSALVQGRDHLSGARPRVLRQQQRRRRRLPRTDREARLPAGARHHMPLAAALLSRRRCATTATTSPTTRTSIRATARSTDFDAFVDAAHARKHPGHHRARHQPHVGPASVVPGGAARAAGIARARVLRLERHRPEVPGRPRSSSPTPRSRTGRGTTPRRRVLLASLLPASAGPQLRQPGGRSTRSIDVMKFWLDLGVDGMRLDAVPYLFEREGTTSENLPETHAVLKRIRARDGRRLRGPHAARRGEPVAGRRPAVLRRRRRMPHGVPLPADAAHVHGAAAGGSAPDHRDPAPDAGHSRDLPVGALSAQSRRADARDGDRRRARLHVSGLRRRSADADQRRHPPAPRAARWRTAAGASSC